MGRISVTIDVHIIVFITIISPKTWSLSAAMAGRSLTLNVLGLC